MAARSRRNRSITAGKSAGATKPGASPKRAAPVISAAARDGDSLILGDGHAPGTLGGGVGLADQVTFHQGDFATECCAADSGNEPCRTGTDNHQIVHGLRRWRPPARRMHMRHQLCIVLVAGRYIEIPGGIRHNCFSFCSELIICSFVR